MLATVWLGSLGGGATSVPGHGDARHQGYIVGV